mmetsp:Transcript_6279/g.12110  ORF Transcript_6279/g.12110 Transcript_6279/m.12110 type:complete len:171 (+) Transcript_6279:139-651(+)
MSLLHGVSASEVHYDVLSCPKGLREEVKGIFPDIKFEDLLVVATNQRSKVDLVKMGEKVEVEKDNLLENFMEWAESLATALEAKGYWSDYVDPCSGLPMRRKECTAVYSEVNAMSLLLGFRTSNAGCCKVLLHPQWGSSVYPASFFTYAPLDVLQTTLEEVDRITRGARV